MRIKSAKSFRKWYKNLWPSRRQADEFWDENFIGTQYGDLSGFFAMYHGDKEEVYNFLRKEVEMAEDGQAIYEFVQNAADCDSTRFYMFYDENYLVVINNGEVFSDNGIKSILNIGQSFGKQDPDKIGRYGIGFKLVHRLVGKSSGLDELLNVDGNGYRGPILFSWSEKAQFTRFLDSKEFEYVDFDQVDAPWLLKILITNFPAQPKEKVRDIYYNEIEPFQNEELENFQTFLKSCVDKIDLDFLESGTVFFLKLGENKYNYLHRQQQEYLNGLSTSMHFLQLLETLVINENVVFKDKAANNVLEFEVCNGSADFDSIGLTEIRDRESNAKFKICFAENAVSANEIKKHPNIYKYFPAVKEVNNLSFVIHCNLFELSSNRQNLTETPINKNLLGLLSKQLIGVMDVYKSENRSIFKSLFISILMSDESPNISSGNGWQIDFFYNNLMDYIKKEIPTMYGGYSNCVQNVKIRKINPKMNLDLANLGLPDIQWFDWDSEVDSLITNEAGKTEKLGIEKWDIRDVVENAMLLNLNDWIRDLDESTYEDFLRELEKMPLREDTKRKLFEVKLFEFSDGNYYSVSDSYLNINVTENYQVRIFNEYRKSWETVTRTRNVEKSMLNNSIIFSNEKTINISSELQKLGFAVSLRNISRYKVIFSAMSEKFPKEKDTYTAIFEKCKTNTLSAKEKKKLFINFISEETKFDNVAEGTLKNLELFCNGNTEIKPLNKLIGNIKTPNWLNPFKINENEYFSELNPYLLSEADDIFKEIYQHNQSDIIAEITTAEEIKSLIKLYHDNQKSFFKEFIIKKVNNQFVIDEKTNETYQVQSADKEARKFLDENCADGLFVLPYEFVEKHKDEEGIIKADDLHSLILEFVDADEHKDILVDIVKFKAKYELLEKLSEFRFCSQTEYTKDHYEYKILDLAISVLKENDYQMFKDKVVIETDNQELNLSVIPPFIDKIKIDEYEISLAKILPYNYENSDHLSSLINQFIGLGLNKERIGKLFGISEEPELSDIFQIFSEQVTILENPEQLAFLFLYGLYIEEIDFNRFKALNVDEEEIGLGTDKYITDLDFIQKSEILHKKYEGVSKIFKNFPILIKDNCNLLLIKEPYFEDDLFICPYLDEDLSDEQKLSFINFIFNLWNKKNKKAAIKNIDWSKIDGTDTVNILGFNPTKSIYPSKYACENEILPDYLISWIGKEENKIDFLTDLGIWTENSVVIELRKYLCDEIKDFHKNRLSQELRFNTSEVNLFNSFEWLKEKGIKLKTEEQFETFKKAVGVINENRTNTGELVYNEEFDFEALKENAIEWEELYYENWKVDSDVSIYLYEGELPKTISLNEISDCVFYSFHEGNTAIYNNKNIYINQNADVKKELRKLELEFDDFDFDGLWQNKLEVLEKENAKLRKSNEATLGIEFSIDISKNDQKEANREAKEIVREKLEKEGYGFTQAIGKYSTIDGVFKDDVEFPLVVKSYKYQDEPLKIGTNEWIQLMKPNSMFWLHFGNRKLGCLKLYELLRNQDKLTISFSTENLDLEDRLGRFAELLHYFGNVHFDFSSVKPSDYSIAKDLSDYRFDERRIEEDLSGDDEDLL
jgi:hypothetical protein